MTVSGRLVVSAAPLGQVREVGSLLNLSPGFPYFPNLTPVTPMAVVRVPDHATGPWSRRGEGTRTGTGGPAATRLTKIGT